jgi:ribonuclease P protein component
MRNRVKRRVRECFRRELRSMIPEGTDLLVIARTGAAQIETRAILSELVTATQSLRRRIETI